MNIAVKILLGKRNQVRTERSHGLAPRVGDAAISVKKASGVLFDSGIHDTTNIRIAETETQSGAKLGTQSPKTKAISFWMLVQQLDDKAWTSCDKYKCGLNSLPLAEKVMRVLWLLHIYNGICSVLLQYAPLQLRNIKTEV